MAEILLYLIIPKKIESIAFINKGQLYNAASRSLRVLTNRLNVLFLNVIKLKTCRKIFCR